MYTPKTLLAVNNKVFKKYIETIRTKYVESLDAEDQFKIRIGEQYKTYFEYKLERTMTKRDRGIHDFFSAVNIIQMRKEGTPLPIKTVRSVDRFIGFAIDQQLYNFDPEIPGTERVNVFLDEVSIFLKKFPGPREIAHSAFNDLDGRWLDSISALKFVLLPLNVDAVIVSGDIVRATIGNDTKKSKPCYVFVHQGAMFKSDWLVYRCETLDRAWNELKPALDAEDTLKVKALSKILGMTQSRIKDYLTSRNSKLAALLIQYLYD